MRSGALCMPGGGLGTMATLSAGSQVLKGEVVPAAEFWSGLPASFASTVDDARSAFEGLRPPATEGEFTPEGIASALGLSLPGAWKLFAAKARGDGVNYVASLLSGYSEPTAELLAEHPEAAPGPGLYHNPYFPNLNLAMAPPLTTTGQVTYDDGTEATVEQMSTDVAAFLAWTAEPTMVQRKQTGWPVLIFLLFATVLAYLSKQQIWAAAKPKKD